MGKWNEIKVYYNSLIYRCIKQPCFKFVKMTMHCIESKGFVSVIIFFSEKPQFEIELYSLLWS